MTIDLFVTSHIDPHGDMSINTHAGLSPRLLPAEYHKEPVITVRPTDGDHDYWSISLYCSKMLKFTPS